MFHLARKAPKQTRKRLHCVDDPRNGEPAVCLMKGTVPSKNKPTGACFEGGGWGVPDM